MDDSPPVSRWIKANGLEFAYLEQGEGPLVLCLHGFPDTANSFRDLIGRLAANGFRAVAPFMRGYAPTSIPADGDYRVGTLARDAIALVDHFGAREAIIVGHDWGAAVAYAAAVLRPDRIKRIVAAAVPHLRRFLLRPTFKQLRRSRYMFQFQIPGWGERKLAGDSVWLHNLVRQWSPGWAFTDDDLAPVIANFNDPARIKAALGYYRAIPKSLASNEGWQIATSPVPVPACVIYGADDGCIGREMFLGQEHLFASDLLLAEIADAGHFMHLEQPQVFSERVIQFLSRRP
jgi:pimeloyl-ACP methyl ester carboxylesterase